MNALGHRILIAAAWTAVAAGLGCDRKTAAANAAARPALPAAPAAAAPAAPAESPDFVAGRLLYRSGANAEGVPMKARIKGDIAEGAAVACANCHLRSGFGSREGSLIAPPIAAEVLFQPVKLQFHGVEIQNAAPKRPAYTDETLLAALRTGVVPTGQALADGMPRYELTDVEAKQLLGYLKVLSAKASPGVEEKAIHLATVVSDGVPAADREAMLFGLRKFVAIKNGQAESYDANPRDRSARMADAMLAGAKDIASKRLTLGVWELHGARETWPQQLEGYLQKEPIFALVGGIVEGSWAPVQAFAESEGVPTIMPFAPEPVAGESNWYTLYTSKGLSQEGAGIAHFLAGEAQPVDAAELRAWIVPSEDTLAVQHGFDAAWLEAGKTAVTPTTLKGGKAGLAAQVDVALAAGKPQVLLLWSREDTADLLELLEKHPNRPERVFVASTLTSERLNQLPENVRPWLWLAWPWRLPNQEPPASTGLGAWMSDPPALPGERRYRIASTAYAASQVMNQALMEMRGHYMRDHLLDVIGMMKDIQPPSWPRLSFGPGQRQASKGCYVVQIGTGTDLNLVARSEWLTH